MDFLDQLAALSTRAVKQLENLQTEEATKMALVAPFINALGYNVFDPTEVIPEFVADVGVKKGEKVDYAIMKDGKAIILFECKCYGTDLDLVHREQLLRYFHVTEARIGVLTDGVTYRFFTDLEEANKMDEKPFLELNILDLDRSPINELKKLTKSAFNIEEMLPAAWELKYVSEFKKILNHQLKSPSDEFVKVIAKEAYSGMISSKKLEQFREVTLQALKQFINEQINSRLQTAMESVDAQSESDIVQDQTSEDTLEDDEGIVTTNEELEGYHIVRAILSEVVESDRVTHKDTKSYMNVLLDNNSWKPICRLHFNSKSIKRIGLFDGEKEDRIVIDSLSDIYQHSERLKAAFTKYELVVSTES
ncbi:MAG: type I restriction endonuclease [Cyanobacteria bacterium P01_D01_bin.44]